MTVELDYCYTNYQKDSRERLENKKKAVSGKQNKTKIRQTH
jgi:hypothetical protein